MTSLPARLVLENGMVFHGAAIGAQGVVSTGELVFNTAMTGYQEVITDPSYCGQIVTFTYPHIGNYGVNERDVESGRIQAAGIVVHELSRTVSNWRSNTSLQSYLEEGGIGGIEGVDTRQLVRVLRSQGSMRCVIVHSSEATDEELVAHARSVPSMTGLDLTSRVTTDAVYRADVENQEWGYGDAATAAKRFRVVAVDFGIKRNILRRLAAHGCDVTVVPAGATAQDILSLQPDGVFLSNGPGDPAAVTQGIATTKDLLGQLPLFGICLGHQILALAVGATTYKLVFGHRGANHPVRNMRTGAIEITSQNHGFAVDASTLPDGVEVTHVNLNDGTCAGIAIPDKTAFGVQYHPEASPGPHDSDYLFREFVAMMEHVGAA